MQENLGCLQSELTAEQVQRLDAVSAIELGFPHNFLTRPAIRQTTFGSTYELIDNLRSVAQAGS